jgi:hypothetical protein
VFSSRLMGTSVEQIDRTYGHRLPDSLERARRALTASLPRVLRQPRTVFWPLSDPATS